MPAPALRAVQQPYPRALPLPPSRERRRLQCYLALMLADIAAVLAGFTGAGQLYLGAPGAATGWDMAALALPGLLTAGLYNGAYAVPALERPWRGARRIVTALALSAGGLLFIAFYAKISADFSRLIFAGGGLLAALGLVLARLQTRRLVAWRCGGAVVNRLVIDDGGPPVDLPGIPRVVLADHGLRPAPGDPLSLDRLGTLLDRFEQVVVSCPPERRAAWAGLLKGANVAGEVIDEAVAQLGAHGARVAGGHGWLRVSAGPLGTRDRVIKRGFDIVVASLALIVLSPLLLAVICAILIDDGAPVLFVQRRVGRGNRFFRLCKFRSMHRASADRAGLRSACPDDDRVTRVGRLIRRTSIDELPQLLNVLAGEMSLVGPRPHALGSQAAGKPFWEADRRYWQRHALKPGLTGLAQVRGLRGATAREADLSRRLDADLEYVDGWSLWRDLAIIFATLRVLVHPRAY